MKEMTDEEKEIEELEAQLAAEAILRLKKLKSGELATYKGFDYELLDDGKFSIYDTEVYKNTYRDTYQLLCPCETPLRDCVEIPSALKGKPVTSMRGYTFTKTFPDKVKSIIIPASVTSISFDWICALADPKIKVTIDPNNPTYKFVDGQLNVLINDDLINNFSIKTDSTTSYFDMSANSATSKSETAKQENFIKCLEKLIKLDIKVEIDESNPRYKFVDGGLYRKDDKVLLYGGGNRSTFTVLDGTTIIAVNALKSDAIKSVVIPSSVRRLEHGIISLSHNVYTIFYKGTKSDWEKIDIDSANDYDFKNKATVYFYSETPSGNSWHYAADGVTPEITHKGGTGFFSKILKKFGL